MFGLIVLTFLLLPTGTAPPLISLGLAALVWIISGKIRCIPSIVRQSWFYPVIPFLVLPWAGLLYSENFDLGMDYALKTKYWVAVFLTAGIAFDEKRLTFLLKWFWAGLLMGAFLALIQFVGIMPPIKEGFLGFGVVHTLICMYLIIGIMMASFYFKKAESWQSKLVLFFLILAFVFHLAVLKGRAGYLIFAILSPLVANNLMNKFSVKLKILMSILLVGLLLLSPVVRAVIKDTVTTLNEQKEKILKGENVDKAPRFFMVHETVEIILAHPFIGVGTGGLAEITKAKGHMVEHPHNNFLYMGASYGIFGIAACFWLFWSMVKISWKSRKTALGYFAFSTCIVLFLGGMFDTQILNTGTLLFLSLTYGLLNHLGNPVD
ncbi:MAG: hypothetical protein KKE44_16260 [Proteobacteria bacterium]|nr:hypothetical protein [Pseudomonadota bacterium]MBU1584283.1 hypothetical protein [Pseudomonadota bacterium]MBU2455323.1 hypothetical protein [Pseudomonadota bacterium]MBU2628180.1 hypothetical protein [Pseudomonadota bacterium]